MGRAGWIGLLLFVLIHQAYPSEKLLENNTYSVYFAFIKVGVARYSLYFDEENGTFRAVSTARTTGIVDKLYTVRDRMESVFTPAGFLRFKAKIREGHYRRDDLIIHDPSTGLITYIKNGKLKRKVKIDGRLFDMVSAFFIYRMGNLCSAGFIVTSGKREATPHVECEGEKSMRFGKRRIKVKVVKLYIPIKGLLVSRDSTKPVVMFIDRRRRLMASKIPTRWGTIRMVIENP